MAQQFFTEGNLPLHATPIFAENKNAARILYCFIRKQYRKQIQITGRHVPSGGAKSRREKTKESTAGMYPFILQSWTLGWTLEKCGLCGRRSRANGGGWKSEVERLEPLTGFAVRHSVSAAPPFAAMRCGHPAAVQRGVSSPSAMPTPAVLTVDGDSGRRSGAGVWKSGHLRRRSGEWRQSVSFSSQSASRRL